MEHIFFILIAGCSHDLSTCQVQEASQPFLGAESHCEEQLNRLMLETPAEWPVIEGRCVAAGTELVLAQPDPSELAS
ncbi:hypothetical protein [Oceanomicrobium pacificus]|uniref:Uncharacterized protein n=1 Tax=Oceanomicrobium pacificus TaxID=2692916 RepID=A0A6B0TI15_9RHOB|nr:hypothetical protein [Oceanomicrobium pacificus]MXU64050.1 hypothetical protein [Oceanomicrobium pacificus]